MRLGAFAVILSMLAPLPALADARADMKAAIAICFDGEGNVDSVTDAAKAKGWTVEADDEMGLVNFYSEAAPDTFGFMAQDGSFCHAESMVLPSEDTAMILQGVVEEYEYDFDKDDMGCTMLSFDGFGTATITSGGQDPTCGSATDSAVRFNFE